MTKFDNGFLDQTPKTEITKGIVNKLNFIKSKNFVSKDTIKKVNRQPT